MLLGRIRCQADKVSGTDFGHIDARSRFRFLTPFSFPPRRVDHKIRATAGPAEHRSHVDFTHVTPHQGKVKGTVGRSAAAKEGTWIGTGHEISGTPHLTLRSRVWCPWYSRRDTRSAMVWPWPNTVTWARRENRKAALNPPSHPTGSEPAKPPVPPSPAGAPSVGADRG